MSALAVSTISLSISIDDFHLHREALRLQLAAQYGVDASLVTLEAAPGSVQLTVTIATTNGTSASTSQPSQSTLRKTRSFRLRPAWGLRHFTGSG